MNKQSNYKVENGLAILTKGDLECCLQEEMLPIINEMLHSSNKPSFENWLDKQQNFEALFRIVFYTHILTAVGMLYNTIPDGVTSSMIKMTSVLKEDIKILGITQSSFAMFRQSLPSAIFAKNISTRNHKQYIIQPEDIKTNWQEIEDKFYFSQNN